MSSVNQVHEERLTLSVDVFLPGHDARVTTPLFTRSRREALEREGHVCFVCGRTAEEAGHPLEDHHLFVERCLAEMVDWPSLCAFVFALEKLVRYAADYCRQHPEVGNVMDFVDDMRVNGMVLCKEHHTAVGTGIHTLPLPLWLGQCWGKTGFQFTKDEALVHERPSEHAPALQQAA